MSGPKNLITSRSSRPCSRTSTPRTARSWVTSSSSSVGSPPWTSAPPYVPLPDQTSTLWTPRSRVVYDRGPGADDELLPAELRRVVEDPVLLAALRHGPSTSWGDRWWCSKKCGSPFSSQSISSRMNRSPSRSRSSGRTSFHRSSFEMIVPSLSAWSIAKTSESSCSSIVSAVPGAWSTPEGTWNPSSAHLQVRAASGAGCRSLSQSSRYGSRTSWFLVLGDRRMDAEERLGVRDPCPGPGREVVRLVLGSPPDERRVLLTLVQVQRQPAPVVEDLRQAAQTRRASRRSPRP